MNPITPERFKEIMATTLVNHRKVNGKMIHAYVDFKNIDFLIMMSERGISRSEVVRKALTLLREALNNGKSFDDIPLEPSV